MPRRSYTIMLFALAITLLVVISARIPAVFVAKDAEEFQPEFTEPPPTPEPTPEPTPNPMDLLREIRPDVSLKDWNLILVNGTYILSPNFAASVVAIRDGEYGEYFDERAIDALEDMLSGAEEVGYTVRVRGAYRPYRTQMNLFNGRATVISENEGISLAAAELIARTIVAYPGTSEHQTGLCADIMDSKETAMVADDVENLPVLVWLRKHCAEYGFIYRYPREKQELTGWFEPWHFRYVGKEAAAFIMEHDLCLEEFYKLYDL